MKIATELSKGDSEDDNVWPASISSENLPAPTRGGARFRVLVMALQWTYNSFLRAMNSSRVFPQWTWITCTDAKPSADRVLQSLVFEVVFD